MVMPLENAVLFKMRRSEFAGSIELQKRTTPNANDGVIYSLFEQAKQQLNRSAAKRFGFFDKDAEHQQLSALLSQWQKKTMPFISLANKAAEYLEQQLAESDEPFAAAVIFAHDNLLGQHYFYCFWLPLVEAIQAGNDLEPFRSEVIEASQMPYALRLHIDAWQAGDSPKYLTMLANRGIKAFSDSFKRFANFSEGVDLGQQTREFLDIVDNYSEQLPEEESRSLKSAVINYCVAQDKIGNPVVIEELSGQLNASEPAAFASFVSTRQTTPQPEILTDRASLKRYMRYFGRDHSLSISFSAERFGSDIQYDPRNGSLTIAKLPKSLKIQLGSYAEKNE
jgi:nucleoid-associated protein